MKRALAAALLFGLARPVRAQESCQALQAPPPAMQVAWISPVPRTVGAGAWLEVVRVQDLRDWMKKNGPNRVRLLQSLGLANARGRGRAVKRTWKVTIFDVPSDTLCRPLAERAPGDLEAGVAICGEKQQSGARRSFTGCGYTRDTGTGKRGLDIYKIPWRDASTAGFCVLPLERFLNGS